MEVEKKRWRIETEPLKMRLKRSAQVELNPVIINDTILGRWPRCYQHFEDHKQRDLHETAVHEDTSRICPSRTRNGWVDSYEVKGPTQGCSPSPNHHVFLLHMRKYQSPSLVRMPPWYSFRLAIVALMLTFVFGPLIWPCAFRYMPALQRNYWYRDNAELHESPKISNGESKRYANGALDMIKYYEDEEFSDSMVYTYGQLSTIRCSDIRKESTPFFYIIG